VTREGGLVTQLSARRQAIIRLLETRDEHLPEPKRRADGVAGFVHRVKVPESCPDCLANDRVMFGCETCGGRGVVERYRERDPYSEAKSPAKYGLDGSRHDVRHERDRQIDMLGRQLRPAMSEAALLEEANKTGYQWENARRAMWKLYDYEAIDLALDELRAHDPSAYRALHAVYIYGWLTTISGAAEAACERGMAFLSPRLAAFEFARGRKLRAPGPAESPMANMIARGRHDDPKALEQRNEVIRRAIYVDGIPTAEVAALYGLTVSQVNRIAREAA
jgi:hypothetical protein